MQLRLNYFGFTLNLTLRIRPCSQVSPHQSCPWKARSLFWGPPHYYTHASFIATILSFHVQFSWNLLESILAQSPEFSKLHKFHYHAWLGYHFASILAILAKIFVHFAGFSWSYPETQLKLSSNDFVASSSLPDHPLNSALKGSFKLSPRRFYHSHQYSWDLANTVRYRRQPFE